MGHSKKSNRKVLENVSVVIPTNREVMVTPETVPDFVEIFIQRNDGINVARNAGIQKATNDWIVVIDDDTEFRRDTVVQSIRDMDKTDLVGLDDYMDDGWVIGRFMLFHKSLWENIGGFDESRHHGGETDFAIRCEKAGGKLLPTKEKTFHII